MSAEQPKFIRVGRFRLTPQFAERVCKHYARRVSLGEMPVAIHAALQSPEAFGENVNAKAKHLLDVIGTRDEASATDREFHAATQRFADHYGLGALPLPKFADEPQEEEQPDQNQPGQGQPSPKKEKSDEADSENDSASKDGENGESKGKPEAGDESKSDGSDVQDQADADDSKADESGNASDSAHADDDSGSDESESGGGEGSEADGESGEGEGGDGAGEQSSDGADSAGEGSGTADQAGDSDEAGNGSSLDGGAAPEVADEPQELDLKAQAPSIANYHERDLPPPEPHPLKPLPGTSENGDGGSRLINPKKYAFDYAGTNQLLACLRAELMSVSRHRAFRDKDAGDVDFTKLAELAQGTNLDRVFYTLTHAQRLNTAVQVFMDISGSMGQCSGKIELCNALCYVLCSALEKLRIPCEVLAFNTKCYVVKPWHQRVDGSVVGRVGCAGGTKLRDAMVSGIQSLGRRRETRLIQAIITDGDVGWDAAKSEAFLYHAAMCEKLAQDPNYAAHREIYLNTAAEHRSNAAIADAELRNFYKSCPRLETYAFGVGIEIPRGIFTKHVDGIQPANMVDTIVQTLGRALVRKN